MKLSYTECIVLSINCLFEMIPSLTSLYDIPYQKFLQDYFGVGVKSLRI